jgi:hypothetical protein
MWPVKETEKGVTFQIRVVPRSPRCEIVGIQDGALKIRITSPPLEGKANDECIRFLADRLKIRRSQIEIIVGHKSRNKTVLISEIKKADVEVLFSEQSLKP